MWREIQTTEDAQSFLLICEQSDPTIYPVSTIKNALEYKSAQLLESNAAADVEHWLYEDGAARAALKLIKHTHSDPSVGRIVTCCQVGFDDDLFTSWKIAFPILLDQSRARFDAWGVKNFIGIAPRTKNGECLAYFTDSMMWEKTHAALHEDGMSYRFQFTRDEKIKPADETKHKAYFETAIVPDALPASVKDDITAVSKTDL